MVLVNNILRTYLFLSRLDGNGHAMLIGTADEQHILSPQPQVAHINIGRHIHPGQVADVNRTVGIRQGGGDEMPFEFLDIVIDILLVAFDQQPLLSLIADHSSLIADR